MDTAARPAVPRSNADTGNREGIFEKDRTLRRFKKDRTLWKDGEEAFYTKSENCEDQSSSRIQSRTHQQFPCTLTFIAEAPLPTTVFLVFSVRYAVFPVFLSIPLYLYAYNLFYVHAFVSRQIFFLRTSDSLVLRTRTNILRTALSRSFPYMPFEDSCLFSNRGDVPCRILVLRHRVFLVFLYVTLFFLFFCVFQATSTSIMFFLRLGH